MPENTTDIRNTINRKRLMISAKDHHAYANAVSKKLLKQPQIVKAKYIGVYLSIRNELELDPFIKSCWALNKKLFLPCLHPVHSRGLIFSTWDQTTKLSKNKFGIKEPINNQRAIRPLRMLDVVITPLVAFDKDASRIGMGGGYYDRSFAFKNSSAWNRPLLIGIAYDFQQMQQIKKQRWDVALDAVITNADIIFASKYRGEKRFLP